jgi:hypothetical protein
MPSGTYHDPNQKHLFIVCTDACPEGNHIIVSVTGWTNDLCDGTTRLAKDDHPFLYKDSYVFYRKARIEHCSALAKGVEAGVFDVKEAMDEAWIKKIMAGLCRSKQTPRKVKKYAKCPAEKPRSKYS